MSLLTCYDYNNRIISQIFNFYKNITAYIIGLSKNHFIKQLKNKIKFRYLKNLNKTILALKKDIKHENNQK